MITEFFSQLFKLFYRPFNAMSDIIDKGHLIYIVISVLACSGLLYVTINKHLYYSYEAVTVKMPRQPHTVSPGQIHIKYAPQSNQTHNYQINIATQNLIDNEEDYTSADEEEDYTPLVYTRSISLPLVGYWGWFFISFSFASTMSTILILLLLYVPTAILLVSLFEPVGRVGNLFQEHYGSLLACTGMAWSAAHLPIIVIGLALMKFTSNADIFLALWVFSKLLFGLFMICAVRTVFGARFTGAIATVALCWVTMPLQILFQSCFYVISSPFILILIYNYARGEASNINWILGNRQSYKRYLEASTVNPRDFEAHNQLGLIHLQRRQYQEAIDRFKQAIEIVPNEPDAHFHLGRIAREQGRLQDAINHFSIVVEQNDKYGQYEIWREIGATYVAAKMYQDAAEALKRYVEKREFDPEGHYYFGVALANLNQPEKAKAALEQAIISVKTSPDHRRRQLRQWEKLAKQQMANLEIQEK